jgi:hypothetical protein
MDAFLFALKFLIIGFVVGFFWNPAVKFAKMFYHGVKEMIHEWNNPRGKQ